MRNASNRQCDLCGCFPAMIDEDDPRDQIAWIRTIGFSKYSLRLACGFPEEQLIPECYRHHHNECVPCLRAYVRARVADGRAACQGIECLDWGCGHVYTNEQIRELSDSATFRRYNELLLIAHLSSLVNFRWCLASGCDGGAIYISDLDSGPLKEISCPYCHGKMCFEHQVPMRKDPGGEKEVCSTCEKGLAEGSEDRNTLFSQFAKACPNPECGVLIEKSAGCNHMRCTQCHTEFCYLCLSLWDERHDHAEENDEMAHLYRNDQRGQ